MTLWRKVPEMSHDDWLIWRNCGLGGSDAPAIMGVSPWATPYQKWEEKVFGKKPEDNASKKFGRDTEKASRMEYEDLVGLKMDPCNVENAEHPWLRASLDGIDPKNETIVEIKKSNREDHATACRGKVPDKYFPQCQHILLVTGKSTMDYFSSPASGGPGKIVGVPRDSAYINNELFPKLKEFWEMVQTKNPPPFVEDDIHPMENSQEWDIVAENWRSVNRTLKALEKEEERLKNELIRIAKGNAEGNGVSLKFSKVDGRINYEAAIDEYMRTLRRSWPEMDFPPMNTDLYRKDPFIKWTARDIA